MHHAPQLYGHPQPVEVTFRLLAPVGKTGNIIGRSGEHIKRIRMETGARIKVRPPRSELLAVPAAAWGGSCAQCAGFCCVLCKLCHVLRAAHHL